MLPLLGPLAPVLRNVHDALQLCLLSDQHYSDAASTPRRSDETLTGRTLQHVASHKRVPFFILVRKLEETAAAVQQR